MNSANWPAEIAAILDALPYMPVPAEITRRGALLGLASALSGPYVVRSGVLMPVRSRVDITERLRADSLRKHEAAIRAIEALRDREVLLKEPLSDLIV